MLQLISRCDEKHKMLGLLVMMTAVPEPSFTKHSLKQGQQESDENMKNVGGGTAVQLL